MFSQIPLQLWLYGSWILENPCIFNPFFLVIFFYLSLFPPGLNTHGHTQIRPHKCTNTHTSGHRLDCDRTHSESVMCLTRGLEWGRVKTIFSLILSAPMLLKQVLGLWSWCWRTMLLPYRWSLGQFGSIEMWIGSNYLELFSIILQFGPMKTSSNMSNEVGKQACLAFFTPIQEVYLRHCVKTDMVICFFDKIQTDKIMWLCWNIASVGLIKLFYIIQCADLLCHSSLHQCLHFMAYINSFVDMHFRWQIPSKAIIVAVTWQSGSFKKCWTEVDFFKWFQVVAISRVSNFLFKDSLIFCLNSCMVTL